MTEKKTKPFQIVKTLLFHPLALFFYGVGAVLLGVWGFSVQFGCDTGGACVDYLYRSIQLFGFEWNLNIGELPSWQLNVARVLAMYVSIAGLVRAFLFATSITLKLLWVKINRFSNHAIVVGLNDLGLRMIDEIVSRGIAVVAIDTGEDPDGKESALNLGAVVISGDVGEDNTLKKAGFCNAKYMVAISNQIDLNIKAAMTAWRLSKQRKRVATEESIKCYVHVPDINIQDVLFKLKPFVDPKDDIRITMFNIYENAVRKLFQKHLTDMVGYNSNYPWNSDNPGKRIVMLIHGEGELTQILLLYALQMFRLPNRTPYIIMAGQSKEFKEMMFLHYPVLKNISEDIQGNDNYEMDRKVMGTIRWIVDWDWDIEKIGYNCHEDRLSIVLTHTEFKQQFYAIDKFHDMWIQLYRKCDESLDATAYVYMETLQDDPLQKDNRLFIEDSKLEVFGGIREVLSYDIVINDKLDKDAEEYHKVYLKNNNIKEDCNNPQRNHRPWRCLSEEYKKSSRYWREFLDYRKKILGEEINELLENIKKDENIKCNNKVLDAFGKLEHERWYVERRLNGWINGQESDKEKKIKNGLVPWEHANKYGSLSYDLETIKQLKAIS